MYDKNVFMQLYFSIFYEVFTLNIIVLQLKNKQTKNIFKIIDYFVEHLIVKFICMKCLHLILLFCNSKTNKQKIFLNHCL